MTKSTISTGRVNNVASEKFGSAFGSERVFDKFFARAEVPAVESEVAAHAPASIVLNQSATQAKVINVTEEIQLQILLESMGIHLETLTELFDQGFALGDVFEMMFE